MATPTEIDRIAAAMNALRPDWKIRSLVTFLTTHHASRAYRDLAIAAAAIATDPKTTTPQLLNQHGPWWLAAQAVVGERGGTLPHDARCPEPGHTSFPAWNCGACRADQLAVAEPAEVTLGITDEQAERNARGAAVVLAALADPPPAPPTEPDAKTLAAGVDRDLED